MDQLQLCMLTSSWETQLTQEEEEEEAAEPSCPLACMSAMLCTQFLMTPGQAFSKGAQHWLQRSGQAIS